ncbi:unnamed protein product, partial [marine sediment metagenome]
IEDTKAREQVVNFLSLPRHRHQIFLLAFHFPRLVMGRYLPFFSAFLIKRPPYLLEFASKSKGDALHRMMKKAEERFSELPGGYVVESTYVVAPRIRWQGMLPNPLCSFWSQELSEVWAGAEVKAASPKVAAGGEPFDPAKVNIRPTIYEGHLIGFTVYDPTGRDMRKRGRLFDLLHSRFPQVTRSAVENAQIGYDDYWASMVLGRDADSK